ncbi:SDR family oxidoreductase [Fusobacterium sp.]|uniref:SDR family NAD(P)-dependent oxidoreductase n=1 Tax=Fusobacterium sp. TaxID=68766 RepID=UPI0025C5EFA5|nr:SDR family NAD(P)-dependent oxidoreductase [Fusobacterium sp.]
MRVLITGATGGIGEALIKLFISKGYEIIAIGRNRKRLDELEKKFPKSVVGYPVDLGNSDEIDRFFESMNNLDINILINGAGVGEIGYFEDISYSDLKSMLDTNVLALTKFTKYFYDKMVKKGEGHIINISSTAGFQQGGALMSAYYATKAYVNSLTLSIYEEGREKGVKVTLLAPGPTKTNFKGMNKELTSFEKLYVTTAEEVAKELWSGLKREKLIVIPGRINRILYRIDKLIPLKLKLKLIKKIQMKKYNNYTF